MNVKSLISYLCEFSIKMDFFAEKGLPEHIVIHIMQHLDNSSLLNLAKCNKRMKNLLGSKKFASRFSLDLKFIQWENNKNKYSIIPVADIEAIHQRVVSRSREYQKLTIHNFIRFNETSIEDIQSAAFELLKMLGETVKEVTIDGSFYKRGNINDLAQMLIALRNVTKYKIKCFHKYNYNDSHYDDDYELDQRFQQGLDFMEIVEELEINSCHEHILNAFSSCTNLKRCAITNCYTDGILDGFLNRQTQLEHLDAAVNSSINLSNWLTFKKKLKSLKIWLKNAYLNAAPLFFRQQNELESLGILINYSDYRRHLEAEEDLEQIHNIIASIWSLPKLKNFKMIIYGYRKPILPETFFNDLPRNDTIERITLRCAIKNFMLLLNSLDAVNEIESECYSHLDLSGLRLEIIAKITKFNEDHLTYAPEEVPENSVEFEKIFGQLLQRTLHHNLKIICIGHPSWLRHQDEFQLSLEFCKNLVEAAPKLEKLKLYNVRNIHVGLAVYLATRKSTKLELVDLYVNDPSLKKMKLHVH